MLFVLMVANSLFKGIEIKSFFSAIIAALILSGLNYTIKPILIYWTLPLTVMTYGIAYPIVNMIILKLCDIIMGSSFNINGFFCNFYNSNIYKWT
ncbi:MAG: phage holin family protein [Clostridium sp.]|nr:MAG: phage holin family protein [Clostridium sp.]